MKTQKIFVINLLLLLFFSKCNNNITDSEQNEFSILPLEGKINFVISEFHFCNDSTCLPQTTLFLRTEHVYSNCNNSIESKLSIDKDEINLSIQGIIVPKIHFTAIGVASHSIKMNIKPGNYTFNVTYADKKDSYLLSVTDSSFHINGDEKSFTKPIYNDVWRYKENSFVYKCQKHSLNDSCDCSDFYDVLKSLDFIREFFYPPYGKSPYQTLSSYDYIMPLKYFFYNNESDFDSVAKELELFPNRDGIRLKNWLNINYH